MRNVILNWQLGTDFGWGLLGLNLFAQWANDARLRPVMGCPIEAAHLVGVDVLRILRILAAVNSSNEYLQQLRERDPHECLDAVCIDALGNDFLPTVDRRADFMIGRAIFETTSTQPARERLSKYEMLLTASTWNAALLREATGREARVIHEGVDVSIFCPGPRSGWLDAERFYVFSGGKIEFRKAQDLVLLAFRGFAARHADAVLVTAWHSPWPDISRGFQGRLAMPLTVGANGMLDVSRWIAENGIDPAQAIDLGAVSNVLMPGILREMHVALQPSRAEACTNLPVKECMACGVPVIAARNTGMLDLLTDENCIMLRRQSVVSAPGPLGTEGWGESDIEEMDAALEFAYQQRSAAAAKGAAARRWLLANGRTWQQHAAALKEWVLANAP